MSLVGAARQTWFFWDGRRDSLWSQALEPLETPAEHGLTRAEVVQFVARAYGDEYRRVFGEAPRDVEPRVRERRQGDRRVRADDPAIPRDALRPSTRAGQRALHRQELAGFRLFVGRAHCVDCHNGPLLSNGEFHNTGVPQDGRDSGRSAAFVKRARAEFTCLARIQRRQSVRLRDRFRRRVIARLEGAFKPPSLRNVAEMPPTCTRWPHDAPRGPPALQPARRIRASDGPSSIHFA